MLELLTYEPFGKFRPEEEKYIQAILSGNDNPPQTMLHDLFLGFQCCVQQKTFENVNWLQQWKAAYGRAHLPLLFKKICFYLMVKGKLTCRDFMQRIGLHVSRLRKWGISPQFRKYAEKDTYSAIRTFRPGVKRQYIVSSVKKLYYEAGRQKSQSMVLKKLPTFVDVFAGTASVAASVVPKGALPDGRPRSIINDFDPLLVCFVWAFTYHQKELRTRTAEFLNDLREEHFETANWSYKEDDYKHHIVDNAPKDVYKNPKAWNNLRPGEQRYRMEVFGESKEYLEYIAQKHQELIIRIRSRYKDVNWYLKTLYDSKINRLRDIDFNKLPKHFCVTDAQENPVMDDLLDYALALFFYYSFPPKNGHIYHEISADARSYFDLVNSLQNRLGTANNAEKAKTLLEFKLKASSVTLESTGHFSKHLQDAEFYCRPFTDILRFGSDKIYYLDSPYFLTAGYNVSFSDDDHKKMLDALRSAEFKWIFSMQYNLSSRGRRTDRRNRGNQPLIKDYGAYYRGFCAPFQPDADQKAESPQQVPSNLFAILFDFKAVKKKWRTMNTPTREMLVVNFNCLATIPLYDTAVILPFDEFLRCADNDMEYGNIVKQAIAWREKNIEKNYMKGSAV